MKFETTLNIIAQAIKDELATFPADQIAETDAVSMLVEYDGEDFHASIGLFSDSNRIILWQNSAPGMAEFLAGDDDAVKDMAFLFLNEGWVDGLEDGIITDDDEEETATRITNEITGARLAECGCYYASKIATVYENGIVVQNLSDPHTHAQTTWHPISNTEELADKMERLPHHDATRTMLALRAAECGGPFPQWLDEEEDDED